MISFILGLHDLLKMYRYCYLTCVIDVLQKTAQAAINDVIYVPCFQRLHVITFGQPDKLLLM